jgi:myo-inositol-1(or 4)-monophosphatase
MREAVEKYLAVSLQAAREAGEALRLGFSDYSGFTGKGAHDLVTESDLHSERIILEHIRKSFPGHAVRSEEAGGELTRSGHQWIVDPLDGTSNFA